MESFIKVSRRLLLAVLIGTAVTKFVVDVAAGSFSMALKNAFAFGTFVTLVAGLLFSMIWVALNLAMLCHKKEVIQ